MNQFLNTAAYRAIVATAICAGFVFLAVFGTMISAEAHEGSLLSCLATSAGLVCDPFHSGSGLSHHELLSYKAVTNSALALYAAAFLLLAAVFIFARFILSGTLHALPVFASHVADVRISRTLSFERIRSWLSLFELSPGR